jgi:hypothetical protein
VTTAAFPDPLSEAVARALAAAAAATDAAHEAESALTARGAAAEAMRATSRRMTVVAAAACGTAVAVVALAGFMSLRSAGALRAATEAQNAAGMVFVAQLVELKGTLETLTAASQSFATADESGTARFTALADQVTAEAEATRKAMADAAPGLAQAAARETTRRIDEMEVTLIDALADIQLSLAQGSKPAMGGAPGAAAAPGAEPRDKPAAMADGRADEQATAALEAASARLAALIDRLEERTAAPSGQTAPAAAPAKPSPATRRAPQAASRPVANPFRFP